MMPLAPRGDGEALNAPLFSVFIPVRNDALWIRGAIESIRAQSCEDWELVVGDNASTENVRDEAAVDDPRVRYQRWDQPVGINENWNRTAALCRGSWIVPLGADDRLLPHALRTFAEAIHERPDLAMVVAACARLDEDGQPAAATWLFYQRIARLRPGDYDARAWIEAVTAPGQPPWNIGSIAFNATALEQVGGLLDPEAGASSDIEAVMRVALAGPVRYLDTKVMIFTQRTDSVYRRRHRGDGLIDPPETLLGQALRVGMAKHERVRGPLSDRERRAVRGAIARSYVRRATERRFSPSSNGRRSAWRDVIRAWQTDGALFRSPRILAVVTGALVLPSWALEAANRVLRQRQS